MQAQEVFQAVSQATQRTEVRDNRAMVDGEVAHQGDVYIARVKQHADIYEICPGLRTTGLGERTNIAQLAPGSTQGSRHVAEGSNLTIYAPDSDASPLEGPTVIAESEWTLTHPEHAHHLMPAGTFVVIFQRDFSFEEQQRVKD